MRRWQREHWYPVGLALLVVGVAGVVAGVALAQRVVTHTTSSPLPGSQFQGADGNQDNPSPNPNLWIDWQGLQADGRVGHTSDPQAQDDIFTGGSKELEPGKWGITTEAGGATPGKTNVLDIYRSFDHAPGSDAFLYLAFTRFSGDGDSFVTFELNQRPGTWTNSAGATVPCRTTGDVLISFDDYSNGAPTDTTAQRWVTETAAANGCAITGHLDTASNLTSNDIQAAYNDTGSITNYLPGLLGSPIPQRQFGEAAVNLSAVLGGFGEQCAIFGSTWMHSRSSLSVQSSMQDYVAPQPFRVRGCKANPGLTSSASGVLKRKAHGKHRLRRHLKLIRSLTINDTATLTGGDNPTGAIRFELFNTTDCAGTPVFTDVATAQGEGSYQSGDYTVTAPGTYSWVVDYSGDDNNNAAGPTKCGADTETVAISKKTPILTTGASGSVRHRRVAFGPRRHRRFRAVRVHTGRVAQPIYDTATLSGGVAPTGSITFDLFKTTDCSGAPVFSSTVPVSGNDTYTSDPYTPTSAGAYRWVARYSGDSLNDSVETGCDAEIVQISPAQPQITTETSGATQLGSPISDTASLSKGWNPTGSITFKLYGPNPSDCSTAIFTSTVPVHDNGTYTSGSHTPTDTGTYRWVASYSGDDNNNSASTTCDDAAEAQVVAHPTVQPTLTTRAVAASALAPAGSPIRDTATLSGGSSPTGTIIFNVYGPTDNSCTGPSLATSTATVSGNGTYNSAPFKPVEAGTYRWIAHYSGDDTNESVRTRCNDALENIVVSKARPVLSTLATPSVTVPSDTQDAATLSGASNPTGMITFELFGPNNDSCSGTPTFSSQETVIGNGRYKSGTFAPQQAGSYHWVATYTGDANNSPAATGCGDRGESTLVSPGQPSLATSASPPAYLHKGGGRVRAAGLSIYDSAKLTGGFAPTGDITFDLYGPDDIDCSTPVFTTSTIVNGNGVYNSESFTPTASGTYRWRATYSGDTNNNAAGPTGCGEATETVRVTVPADTSLITSASDAVALGGAVHDTATLSGGSAPTGTITFRLYAPNDTSCTSQEVFTSTVAVSGNGDYTSGSFVPTDPGAYHWVASYSGDAANHPSGTSCGDPGESVVVRPPSIPPVAPTFSTTASPTTGVGAPVYDTAHLGGGVSPSGAITFKLFGPSDPGCTGTPVFTTSVAVNGNGDYRSAAYATIHAGTYRWVVSYGGDAMNLPAGPTACGDNTETVSVTATPVPSPGPDVGAEVVTRPKPKPTKLKHKPRKQKAPAFTG